MTFNTAVSGLRAANSDLEVIGNNIANASTTGAKGSRAEFADVYASAALGGGDSSIGSGVLLSSVKQTFEQGNISFTNNSMDMAINGEGFFILDNDGANEYTRAGIFGVNNDGFLVGSDNRLLQGFPASSTGAISGTLGDLQIATANLPPQQTSSVDIEVNLDAGEVEPTERGTNAETTGDEIGDSQLGTVNGYSAETVTVVDSAGTTRSFTTTANDSARAIASNINAFSGVSASASTTATLSDITDGGNLTLSLNGVPLVSSTGAGSVTPQSIAVAINQLTNDTLRGITALQDDASGTVTVTSSNGTDLSFTLSTDSDVNDSFTVSGTSATEVTITGDDAQLTSTVGGTVSVTLDNDVTIESNGDGTGLFAADVTLSPFVNQTFDPTDQDTYNHATSINVFDSLGNDHVLTMYFVKEPDINTWTMYTLIDGEDVGDPNRALDPPFDQEPTRASFNMVFNNDGTLDEATSDDINISYWNPTNDDGESNGSLNGVPVADGAVFPVVEPFSSSNFSVDVGQITQFGSNFSVNDISQNGHTTGRVNSIDISNEGVIFARYTNGQSLISGQVALANFRNEQGLQPIGNTAWVETFDSGNVVVGTPGSAQLGGIQSGALEESNVELSQELVKLIIAQRNIQANARTIESADESTQAIINI